MDHLKSTIKNILGSRSLPLLEIYYMCRSLWFYGKAHLCPCCNSPLRQFLSANIGSPIKHSEIRCPRCDSHPRHRLLWLFLQEHGRWLFSHRLKLLHIAPEFCFLRRFRAMQNLEYITGDLSSPLTALKVDVTCLPFANETFDVVICNHVLEHVEDDDQAMRELLRILKPTGWGILQVPVDMNRQKTFEDSAIKTPEERTRHFGQADHVRQYGADYAERLRSAGFSVNMIDYIESFEERLQRYHGLVKGEPVFFCHKLGSVADSVKGAA